MKIINAYAAGLFDGEGCIILNKRKRSSGTYYYLQSHVSMTHKPIIDFLHLCYGGQIYIRDRKPGKWKRQWDWCLNSTEAYNFLVAIRPHTIVKRQEIETAVAYHEHSAPSYHNPKGTDRDSMEQYGEYTKQLLSSLKKQEH